jgi:hypothetical protein
LEDVADNMVSSQLARGEKETMVIRALCETLSKTGSSPEIVATTMMAALRRAVQRSECDIMKDIGRTMHEQGTESELQFPFMSCLNLVENSLHLQRKIFKRP